jgi:hypothetical protein
MQLLRLLVVLAKALLQLVQLQVLQLLLQVTHGQTLAPQLATTPLSKL